MKTAEDAVLTLGEISGKMKLVDWKEGNEYPEGLDLESVTIALTNIYSENITNKLIQDTLETLIAIEEETFVNGKQTLMN
jgi:hypothetical protein